MHTVFIISSWLNFVLIRIINWDARQSVSRLLPYTWCKNLSIWTGISYNTSLNPIVQFCITLYCITFPSCLANEIYFSLLCTSKTYPIYSKQFKRKSYHIEKEFQVRKLVNVHQGIVPVYLYCHENVKNCKQRRTKNEKTNISVNWTIAFKASRWIGRLLCVQRGMVLAGNLLQDMFWIQPTL